MQTTGGASFCATPRGEKFAHLVQQNSRWMRLYETLGAISVVLHGVFWDADDATSVAQWSATVFRPREPATADWSRETKPEGDCRGPVEGLQGASNSAHGLCRTRPASPNKPDGKESPAAAYEPTSAIA